MSLDPRVNEDELPNLQHCYSSALDPSRLEIRLLRIEHLTATDSPSTLLKLTVTVHPLSENLLYTALSYEWQLPTEAPSLPVIINGSRVYLRSNLVLALERLRKMNLQGYVWVDAICINQRHTSEKEYQVNIMNRIYSTAKHTFAWPGPKMNDSHLAIAFLIAYSDCCNIMEALRTIENRYSSTAAVVIRALLSLMTRSYWKRAWIVQEIVLGALPACTLAYGDDSFNFLHLQKFCHDSPNFYEFGDIDQATYSRLSLALLDIRYIVNLACSQMDADSNLWITEDWATPGDILDLLVKFRNQHATLAYDKVYCLLGIAKPLPFATPADKLEVDYAATKRDVLTQLAVSIIKGTKSFSIFKSVTRIEPTEEYIPTWVPDWIHAERTSWEAIPNEIYSAGRTHYNFAIINSEGVLHTHGYMIGMIRKKSQFNPRDASSIQEMLFGLRDSSDSLSSTLSTLYELIVKLHASEESAELIWPFEEFCQHFTKPRQRSPVDNFASFAQQNMVTVCLRYDAFVRCETSNGERVFGVTKRDVKLQDVIFAVPGSQFLVVLRPEAEAQHYTFVSLAFIDMFKNGEALSRFPREDVYIH